MSKQLITFWQQHVSQWKDSALTQAQYCKKHQLNPQRLSHHKRKLETQETAQVKTGFIALPIPEYLPKPELLTLHFASGLSLSGIAPNNIDVVKQLTAVLS
jgi:hypothetical protein